LKVALSKGFPNNPEIAQKVVQEGIRHIDGSRLDSARQSAVGLLKAAEYGIDRYPAIVFDSNAVVYGVTDISEALWRYWMWEERKGQ
jgi:integrating conjugative element protein (TIGR03757 family)